MASEDEFFIGYGAGMGPSTRRRVTGFALVAIGFALTMAVVFGFFQRGSANSGFDFDSRTEVEGVYFARPYPSIRVDLGNDLYRDVVLVGFGKFGPAEYLDPIVAANGPLDGKRLRLQGNLIYYNGKTLLQMDGSTEITVGESTGRVPGVETEVSDVRLVGEIVDPKCFFGVMKPGYGKIHRSCAARCISGGIPPVLVTTGADGDPAYYLLADASGQPLHREIVPHIGVPSLLEGQLVRTGDWSVLKVDPAAITPNGKPSNVFTP